MKNMRFYNGFAIEIKKPQAVKVYIEFPQVVTFTKRDVLDKLTDFRRTNRKDVEEYLKEYFSPLSIVEHTDKNIALSYDENNEKFTIPIDTNELPLPINHFEGTIIECQLTEKDILSVEKEYPNAVRGKGVYGILYHHDDKCSYRYFEDINNAEESTLERAFYTCSRADINKFNLNGFLFERSKEVKEDLQNTYADISKEAQGAVKDLDEYIVVAYGKYPQVRFKHHSIFKCQKTLMEYLKTNPDVKGCCGNVYCNGEYIGCIYNNGRFYDSTLPQGKFKENRGTLVDDYSNFFEYIIKGDEHYVLMNVEEYETLRTQYNGNIKYESSYIHKNLGIYYCAETNKIEACERIVDDSVLESSKKEFDIAFILAQPGIDSLISTDIEKIRSAYRTIKENEWTNKVAFDAEGKTWVIYDKGNITERFLTLSDTTDFLLKKFKYDDYEDYMMKNEAQNEAEISQIKEEVKTELDLLGKDNDSHYKFTIPKLHETLQLLRQANVIGADINEQTGVVTINNIDDAINYKKFMEKYL